MSNRTIEDVIRKNRILPVLVIDDVLDAIPAFRSIEEGGLECIEITLRTEVGLKAIGECAANFENIYIGAGTVLSASQATQSINEGAQFLLSPGFSQEVFECAQKFQIPYFPGTATATEIQNALLNKMKIVKFFPAEPMGGIAAISAISSALADVEFIPTGGIDEDNFLNYLRHPKVACVGGSWVASRKDIRDQNTENIKSKIKKALLMIEIAGL